ncbi:TPA: fatty acid desaturase [Neisseria meningitidis]
MYHKKFDKEILLKIKELYRYDNWHAVLAILYDYLIIIFSIFLSEQSYWFLPLTILLIGSRQRALATILHEASHSALTKNKKFGQILGTYFSGYLIFQSWNSYCVSHVKNHHPKLGLIRILIISIIKTQVFFRHIQELNFSGDFVSLKFYV